MIDVFKKFAPRYKKLVRRYALKVWKNKATKKTRNEFFDSAERFQKQYKRALVEYYEEKDINIYRGTIDAKAAQWLKDQKALIASVEVIAKAKKNNLIAEQFEKLKESETGGVQKMLNKIYLSKEDIEAGGEVYKVFSFADNLEDRAEQLGEESSFDLGRDINQAVLEDAGETYKWQTQEDAKVRKTHRMLAKKIFSWGDPPTTIDKYNNKHTGHPGTDWGCRCYAVPARGKPLLNFVAKE